MFFFFNFLSHGEVFNELLSSQGHALVWGLADQRGVGPHGPTVLLLMVTASLPHPLISIVCRFHMRVCVDLLTVACVWCLSSVPDLRDYRVWLGDSFNRQEISIAHVICGPEGSSLALMRLSQWVPDDYAFTIFTSVILSLSLLGWNLIMSCWCLLSVGPPAPQTTSIQSSSL